MVWSTKCCCPQLLGCIGQQQSLGPQTLRMLCSSWPQVFTHSASECNFCLFLGKWCTSPSWNAQFDQGFTWFSLWGWLFCAHRRTVGWFCTRQFGGSTGSPLVSHFGVHSKPSAINQTSHHPRLDLGFTRIFTKSSQIYWFCFNAPTSKGTSASPLCCIPGWIWTFLTAGRYSDYSTRPVKL